MVGTDELQNQSVKDQSYLTYLCIQPWFKKKQQTLNYFFLVSQAQAFSIIPFLNSPFQSEKSVHVPSPVLFSFLFFT